MGRSIFAPDDLLNDTYRILEQVGSGGMGEVYAAHNVRLEGSRFAVKTLRRDAFTKENAERFEREARALAKLRHPNIVLAVDFGRTREGYPFLVMEFVDGRDLAQELQTRGTLPPGEAAEIVGQLAGALGAMHARDIFHRDVKPQNVLLVDCGYDGRPGVKLLDFGIAKDRMTQGLTKVEQTVGTVMYMAPERFIRGTEIGQFTDQYALAAITYELLSGRPAFLGSADDVERQKLGGELPTLLPKPMPFTLQVIRRGMALEQAHRYPSVGEFHRELAEAIKKDSTSTTEVLPTQPNLPATEVLPVDAEVQRQETRDQATAEAPAGTAASQAEDASRTRASGSIARVPARKPQREGQPTRRRPWGKLALGLTLVAFVPLGGMAIAWLLKAPPPEVPQPSPASHHDDPPLLGLDAAIEPSRAPEPAAATPRARPETDLTPSIRPKSGRRPPKPSVLPDSQR